MPNQYDYIIIGAGHNGLVAAAYLAKAKNKALVSPTRAYGIVRYAVTAMYSAEAAPSGIGSLSSIKP